MEIKTELIIESGKKKVTVKKGDEVVFFEHSKGVFLKGIVVRISEWGEIFVSAIEVIQTINQDINTKELINKEYRLSRYSYKNDNIYYYDDGWCFSNNTRFLNSLKAKALKYYNEQHKSHQRELKIHAERERDLEAIKKIVENGYNILIYGNSGLTKIKVNIRYDKYSSRYYCMAVDNYYTYPIYLDGYRKTFFTDEDDFYKNHNHYRRERQKIIDAKKIFGNDTVTIYQLETDHITLIKTADTWVFNRPQDGKTPASSLTVKKDELFTRLKEITSSDQSLKVELKEMFS